MQARSISAGSTGTDLCQSTQRQLKVPNNVRRRSENPGEMVPAIIGLTPRVRGMIEAKLRLPGLDSQLYFHIFSSPGNSEKGLVGFIFYIYIIWMLAATTKTVYYRKYPTDFQLPNRKEDAFSTGLVFGGAQPGET